jgi:hypothetical protein
MMPIILILFVVAALGGATVAVLRFRGAPRPPTWLALAHGAIVALGFSVLGYEASTVGLPWLASVGSLVLVLAALGGATLFIGFHLREKPLPIALVLGHGLIALTGFALLASSYLKLDEHVPGVAAVVCKMSGGG